MPLMHCETCHHEYEDKSDQPCDWCGAAGYVLVARTELALMLDNPEFWRIIARKAGRAADR